MKIIDEGGVGTNEHVILNLDSVPKLDSAFDGHPVTDHHIVLDEDVGTDIAILADHGLCQNNTELPDFGTDPDG
jgi:hypothetical protein